MDLVQVCRVCGDEASGINYNQFTCQSCKVFFHRHSFKLNKRICRHNGNCPIDINTRKCLACRLNKCFKVGMQRKCNKSDKWVAQSIKTKIIYPKIEEIMEVMIKQNVSIENFKYSSDVFGKSIHHRKNKFQLNNFEQKLISELKQSMTIFADENRATVTRISTNIHDNMSVPEIYFKWIATFCQSLNAFKCLNGADQLKVLKRFCFDLLAIRLGFIVQDKEGFPMISDDSGNEAIFVNFHISRQIEHEYTEHYVNYWSELKKEMENDCTIRDLLIAQSLFKCQDNVKCVEFLRYNYIIYSHLLRKYLESKYKSVHQATQKLCSLSQLINQFEAIKQFESFVYTQEIESNQISHIMAEVYDLL